MKTSPILIQKRKQSHLVDVALALDILQLTIHTLLKDTLICCFWQYSLLCLEDKINTRALFTGSLLSSCSSYSMFLMFGSCLKTNIIIATIIYQVECAGIYSFVSRCICVYDTKKILLITSFLCVSVSYRELSVSPFVVFVLY